MHTGSQQPVITSGDIRRGHKVLADLMTMNTGMGRAVQRMNDYEAEHGHLPPDQLRTLAGLLYEVAGELDEYADQLDAPVPAALWRSGGGRP